MRIFMRVGRLFTRALITVLLFLLSARGGETAELRKFSVGYSTVGPAGIGLWMAKEIGAFDKYGIDAELIFVSSGPVAVQALLGGDMKAGLAATNAVTSAVLAGAPLVSQHRGGSHRGGSSWRVKSLPLTLLQMLELSAASDFHFSATACVCATRLGRLGKPFIHFVLVGERLLAARALLHALETRLGWEEITGQLNLTPMPFTNYLNWASGSPISRQVK